MSDVQLVKGWWCQERGYGWLPGSATACAEPGHHHIESARNPAQPEHSIISRWRR